MRKKTRRKVYSLINPIKHAIEGAAITAEKDLDQLRLRELDSIHAFSQGRATVGDWHNVNAILGLCETMANAGVGPEALEACAAGQEALIDAKLRYDRTKRMGTTGAGLQAFRDLYEFHDLQRQCVSRSEYERFIRLATARMKSHAPGVVVL